MSVSPLPKRNLALLLSALVFPGSGHFVLGRKARGCLFLVPALVALVLVLRQIMAARRPGAAGSMAPPTRTLASWA